ncbi:MAG: PD40 domain-containing protein [Stigonema ocellatum SAG 48.90 = DSM 106950]|nr:PD40 domain-containing protein [Stigonema ocellatum SAG 48.90 = DSM 106950]
MDSTQRIHGSNPDVKTILILAANPQGTSRLQLDKEVREIDEGLRRGFRRSQFRLEQKWAVRQRDFYRAILDFQPQIVHFSGHGTGVDGIVLEDETDQPVEVNALALASMFKVFAKHGVQCVVLNACYSQVQAKAISQHINYVIGMNKTVGDKAAIAFSVAFYDALAAGQDIEDAYELACAILINYLEQQTPVLFKKDQISIIEPEVEIIPPNPYQGLAAFGEEDAAFFFGRETFVNGLVEAVNKQPLVAVIGPSGSGKSSVVYAGLIPHLRTTGNWLIESFRPSSQPFYQIASALVRQLEPEVDQIQQLRSTAGLDKDIQQGIVTLQQITSRIIERNPDKRLLLFVDQFEELYTLCQKEEQERFADLMLEAIHQKILTLVFTLRADFYGFVLAYRPFRDALQQFTPQLLSAMNREELLRAIEQPAQKIKVQLEAQLAQRILDDVGNEPGNLPLLEFAMTRLWEKQQNRKLIHQAYDEIGGVKKALANHAEQIYQQLNEQEQKQARRIFVQLVRPGEGTEDTRRIATRAEIGDDNWGLVSYLAGYKARLVVTGRDEKSGEDTVEVVHEALIREWLTLREWMNANRQFRVWQERLKVLMLEWKNSNHDSGALLRGVPLGVAQEWLHKRSSEMTLLEQDFISVSTQQHSREIEEQSRRRRRSIQALIAGLAGALSLSGFAFWQWQQAEKGRVNAEFSVQSLTTENLFASGLELDALLSGLKTGKNLKQHGNAVDADNHIKAIVALEQVETELKEHNRLAGHSDVVNSVVFSPDGKTIATASRDKTVKLWNLSGQLLHTLQGHSDEVYSVVFSPDGKTIATGSKDNIVKLWSLSGQLRYTFQQEPSSYITSPVFSPDGKTIAIPSKDKTVKLWNLSGQLLHTLQGHSGKVLRVVFSPDGKTIATGSTDKTVKLWNLSGQLLHTLEGHKGIVWSVVFSPDGKTIATASQSDFIPGSSSSGDKTVKLWNLSGQLLHTLQGHSGEVLRVVFSPDGKTIATGSKDKTVNLWNLSGQLLHTLQGHSDQVAHVVFSPDGNTIATGATFDNTVKLWNLSGQLLHTFQGHSGEVNSVVFSPDGNTIATGSTDKTVKLWNLSGQLLHTLQGHSASVTSVVFSPDGNTIATASHDFRTGGSEDKTVKLWNLSGLLLHTLQGHSASVTSVVFSPDGNTIATASFDSTVKLWNLSGQLLHTLQRGSTTYYTSPVFSPDGNTIATSDDNTVKLWNLSGQLLRTLQVHSSSIVTGLVFSPDGKTIATGITDSTVKLWNLSGQLLHTLEKPGDGVTSVVFSPDGNTIATHSQDNIVKLWNLSGQLLHTLQGHSGEVNSVVFSPDGNTIATGSKDNTVKLWNLSGQLLHTLQGHRGEVHSVVVSPDGNTSATGSTDNTVTLWNLSGQLLHTLQGHSGAVNSVVFSPDGNTIATGSEDKTVKLWNMNLDDLLIRGCAWVSDYLNNNPNVKDDERHLCDDIAKKK